MSNDNHDKNDNLNPFSPHHPAQPEYFANRKNELANFERMAINSARLKIPAPENYAILGTWGQGKTSVIYKFRQMATEELQKEIKCVCIYFPLSPESCNNWETFTLHFVEDIPSKLTSTKGLLQKVKSEATKWEVGLNIGGIEAKRKSKQRQLRLVDALESLWKKHLEPCGVQVAFVMLDDLHYFPLKSEENAYLTLRTTFQELVNRKCNYSLVVTAPTLLFTDITEVAEPLGRFFRQIELTAFSVEDAEEAVERRLRHVGSSLKVTSEAIDLLVKATGGHPYLFIFAMHEILNSVQDEGVIDKGSFVKYWPEVERSLGKQVFAQKFQKESETERRLMLAIAKTNLDVVSPGQIHGFGGTTKLFSRLEKDEILIRTGRGQYKLFHPLFAEYLKRM